MESGTASPSPAVKKGLQELSKEELIQKCKGLLNIAQKAKQAKDGKKWGFWKSFAFEFFCVSV